MQLGDYTITENIIKYSKLKTTPISTGVSVGANKRINELPLTNKVITSKNIVFGQNHNNDLTGI